jgi:hypothetical protein
MIEIILLIVGIVNAVRIRRLRKLTPQDFPGVNAAKFVEWQRNKLLAIDFYIFATCGAVGIKFALSFILSHMRLTDDEFLAASVAGLVAWLGVLTVAVVFGSIVNRKWTALMASRNETMSRKSPQVAREPALIPIVLTDICESSRHRPIAKRCVDTAQVRKDEPVELPIADGDHCGFRAVVPVSRRENQKVKQTHARTTPPRQTTPRKPR